MRIVQRAQLSAQSRSRRVRARRCRRHPPAPRQRAHLRFSRRRRRRRADPLRWRRVCPRRRVSRALAGFARGAPSAGARGRGAAAAQGGRGARAKLRDSGPGCCASKLIPSSHSLHQHTQRVRSECARRTAPSVLLRAVEDVVSNRAGSRRYTTTNNNEPCGQRCVRHPVPYVSVQDKSRK